ncbi:MAG TPA: FeoA domain-containing protein, partial [Fervidobacterium nodosum]|nr:FeoA domain-containing protein [Fervidobacterium nodosum]
MKLSEVPIGAIVEVKRVLPSDISPKLRAVGILPGVRIEVIK